MLVGNALRMTQGDASVAYYRADRIIGITLNRLHHPGAPNHGKKVLIVQTASSSDMFDATPENLQSAQQWVVYLAGVNRVPNLAVEFGSNGSD